MIIPEFMKLEEWHLVVKKCILSGVNPYLIAAIGWHETHWGRLGWGKLGFHLGVGCYSEKEADYSYQGLNAQVSFATSNLQKYLLWLPNLEILTDFSKKIWRSGNPTGWAQSVNGYFKKYLDSYGSDLYSYSPAPEWCKKDLVDFYEEGFINTPFGSHDFYRAVVMVSNILKAYLKR